MKNKNTARKGNAKTLARLGSVYLMIEQVPEQKSAHLSIMIGGFDPGAYALLDEVPDAAGAFQDAAEWGEGIVKIPVEKATAVRKWMAEFCEHVYSTRGRNH